MDPNNPRYELWKHLLDEHGVTLLDSDIREIVDKCRPIIAEDGATQPDPAEDCRNKGPF